MGNSAPKLTLKEQVRQNKRELDRAIRELDRERTGLERQQEQLQANIKKAAREGQTVRPAPRPGARGPRPSQRRT